MSLRYEQYNALKLTEQFLLDLCKPGTWTKKELIDRARSCLRHFPFLDGNGKPMFSKDDFTKD